MNWLRNLPIKRKLNLVILMTCSLALFLACVALALYQWYDFRRTLVSDTTALADVSAKDSRAALTFEDNSAAQKILLALQSEPDISAACLYNANNSRFSSYTRKGLAVRFPARPEADGPHFAPGHLVVIRPVLLNGKRIGTIYLQADLQEIYDRLGLFGGIAVLALCGSILMALMLSSRLQRHISEPILALAGTAKAVAERKDYTVRATSHGAHEIGTLTSAFNQMLQGIEERETALRAANDALRGEIAERKNAEGKVQAQLARLELLHRITRAISERLDLQSIFQVVIGSVEHLPVDFSSICRYERNANLLIVAGVGVRSEKLATELDLMMNVRLDIDPNGLSRCVQGQLVYEPDIGQSQFPFPKRLARVGLRSLVAAPLTVESQVFGVLIAARKEPNGFSSGECEFLRQLSEHVALAAHQSQLYEALQQAYNDLRQTQQAVMQQERLRALGQMASGIAHDINNAISPVALYTESLLETEPNLSERARNYLGTIAHAIDDVTATVGRMREFYRQREPQLTLVPVKLNQLMQQVIDLSRARWSDMPQQRGVFIKIETDLAPDLPVIMGVESEIREALVNLVFNAVDAMPEGGTLTLRTKMSKDTAQLVQAEVSDTGIGMDEDTRRRCLEPFFTTKGERGTGLGLAMVYGIARRHNAEVEIESAPGKGTTVRLIFPAPAAPVSDTGQTAVAFTVPTRLRILVVDDDPLLIKSLRDTLETDGHVVVTASAGQDGIDTFRKARQSDQPFAVVVTDLGMPYVDGRQVASAVKSLSPSTPVIMLTGWGQRLMAEGDIPPHVDRVLNKPPKLRDLREALAQCLPPKES
jgi:signal transduction histidine kinase/ActR/RegA family two-component response regulator